jgi:hypothetical protein
MKAVRLRNRKTHDAHYSYCGRRLIDLPIVQEFETDNLPGDACRLCRDAGEAVEPPARVVLPPSYGRLYTTGPISHGPRSKLTGRRLFDHGGG